MKSKMRNEKEHLREYIQGS